MKIEFDARRRDAIKRANEDKQYSQIVEIESNVVPRVGERVWCDLFSEMTEDIDEDEWRVVDVWWLLSPTEDDADCVVFVVLMNVDENGVESKVEQKR
jgi:hypothetical protein